MTKKNTLGPLQLAGKVFHTTGTVVNVVDSGVTHAGEAIEHTLTGLSTLTETASEAIKIATTGALEDMRISEVGNAVRRKLELIQALAEANKMLKDAGIDEPITLENLKTF